MIVVARQEFLTQIVCFMDSRELYISFYRVYLENQVIQYYIFMLKSLSHSAFSSVPFAKLCNGLPGCCCTVAPLHCCTFFIGCQAAFEILGNTDEFWHLGPQRFPIPPRFHMHHECYTGHSAQQRTKHEFKTLSVSTAPVMTSAFLTFVLFVLFSSLLKAATKKRFRTRANTEPTPSA